MSGTLTFPYLDLTAHDVTATLLLTDDQKWTLVDRLFTQHDHARGDIPAAWADTPLSAWCWLVLVVNHLDFNPGQPHPLTHWGIDLGFSSTALRRWIWTIA